VDNAKDCIQVLGGIGFTWEHDAHLYLRRALALRQLLGGSRPWRERLAVLAANGPRRQAQAQAQPESPYPGIGAWAGPAIEKYGTEAQRQRFLAPTRDGRITWCQLFSEPEAGSDLASLKTRAVRDGESYVINGQKMWTSLSSDADYCWLACRTDPNAAKHKGISMIIVPMDTPGITLSPLNLLGSHDINAVFFEDVIVPAANVMGGENHGWKLITNQLNHERVTLFASGVMDRALSEVTQYAQETKLPDGRRIIDQPWVQYNLAKLQAKVEVVRLMNWQVAWEATQGVLDIGHCSALKVYGSELNMEGYQLLMEIIGPVSYLEPDAPGAVLKSRIQQGTRGSIILTFGGGVNEMQRDLISQFTLGFPRADR
jgi:3-oxocholest-4-en-26-oyl-CoA dehydrogenase alpha subunit